MFWSLSQAKGELYLHFYFLKDELYDKAALFGSHFGRAFCVLHGSVGCVSSLDISLASGGRPPRLKPPFEVGLSPGAPKRGMPTGPDEFLGLPDASGLQPCDRTHLKNGLVPYSYVGGAYDKYSTLSQRSSFKTESYITWSHSPYFEVCRSFPVRLLDSFCTAAQR